MGEQPIRLALHSFTQSWGRRTLNSRPTGTTKQDPVLKHKTSQAVVTHTFNPSTQEAGAGSLCELEGSLVYRVSSRTGSIALSQKTKNQPNKQKTKTTKPKLLKLVTKVNFYFSHLNTIPLANFGHLISSSK
ncbi:hypothetical protein ACRRTK_007805 [Alexandromys fortis]